MARKKEELSKKFQEELEAYRKKCEENPDGTEKVYHEDPEDRMFVDDDDF